MAAQSENTGWYYTINHKKARAFSKDELVFLKANPSFPMMVYKTRGSKVVCVWIDENNDVTKASFPPELLLQYKYRCLQQDQRGRYNICLN